MNFKKFQATRKRSENLRTELEHGADWFDRPTPGFIYAGSVYIEDDSELGYCLTIYNNSRCSHDLGSLELELFQWCEDEGLFADEEPATDDERSYGRSV